MSRVVHCARCGGTHEKVAWEKLERPIEDTDGTEWTEWTPCPKNGQPILSRTAPAKRVTETSVNTE